MGSCAAGATRCGLGAVWKKDPLVQADMLNSDMAIVDTPVLQMPVTSQRHENRELPN
jgi:hypothetical protein